MAGIPVVIKPSGGLPVTISAYGVPMEIATNGFGLAVTQVTNGLPVSGLTFGPTLQLTGNSVAENLAANTTVGTLSVTPGTTGTPTYTLTDSAGGKFNISGNTLRTSVGLNYEAATFHNVTVSVSGLTPAVSPVTFTILVINVDDTAPIITSSNTVSNVENMVLTHVLTANEPATFVIVGGVDMARFEISGSTLRWAGNGTKDFEAPDDSDANNTYQVQVSATDLAANMSTPQTITVTVLNDTSEVLTAPVNTLAPAVTGTLIQGQILSCSTGTWTGTAPITYARQWYQALDDGSGGILTDGSGKPLGDPIVGATSATYTLVAGDVGDFIFCIVTATNAAGSGTAHSNVTATPIAPPAVTYLGPGDVVPGAAWWVGLRAYSAAYAASGGPAIDIVDGTGASTQVINVLANGLLDEAAVATWSTTHGTPYVKKLYDQTGNGRHFNNADEGELQVNSIGTGGTLPSIKATNNHGIVFTMAGGSTSAPPFTFVHVCLIPANELTFNFGNLVQIPGSGGVFFMPPDQGTYIFPRPPHAINTIERFIAINDGTNTNGSSLRINGTLANGTLNNSALSGNYLITANDVDAVFVEGGHWLIKFSGAQDANMDAHLVDYLASG